MNNRTCGCGRQYEYPTCEGDWESIKNRTDFSLFFAGVDVGIDEQTFRNRPCLNCTREESLKKIERFISIVDEVPVVNWALYAKSGVGYTTDVLVKLGILRGNCDRNCIIISQTQGCLNPKHGSDRVVLYFHSPNDAKAYANIVSHSKDFDIMVIAYAL